MCEYAPEKPRTLSVDADILHWWAKVSGDCVCSKICMLYSLVPGFAVHAVTAIIRNKND